jgi:hypothetical protein
MFAHNSPVSDILVIGRKPPEKEENAGASTFRRFLNNNNFNNDNDNNNNNNNKHAFTGRLNRFTHSRALFGTP